MARTIILAMTIIILMIAAEQALPYDCTTDSECEAEEAARCWILCQ